MVDTRTYYVKAAGHRGPWQTREEAMRHAQETKRRYDAAGWTARGAKVEIYYRTGERINF